MEAKRAHRPGLFKLPQKKHSIGRHRSKRTIARENRGKKGESAQIQQKARELKRVERRNRLTQIRANKAAQLLEQKRHEGGAPTLITLISLDNECPPEKLVEKLCSADPEAVVTKNSEQKLVHLAIPRFKARYCLLYPNTVANLFETLDCLRASDLLILYWPTKAANLARGSQQLLDTILAQGVQQTLNVVSGIPQSGRQREAIRKALETTMGDWLNEPSSRPHNLDTPNDSLNLLRLISTMKKTHSNLQKMRPYLLVESMKVEQESDNSSCSLQLSGYLRGAPLDVNKLVHIPGYGDFQLSQVECRPDPVQLMVNKRKMEENSEPRILRADPTKQIPLDSEISPDRMDNDQALEEEEDVEDKFDVPKVKKSVPKGTSEYQAAWLIDEDDEDDGDEEGEEEEGSDEEENVQGQNLDVRMEEASDGDEKEQGEEQDVQSEANTFVMDTNELNAAEKEAMDESQMERFRRARENLQWPDEVETPRGMSARERFQRYRGLKSFRTSPWDPKENLPQDYARIYKLVDFKRARKLALAETEKAFQAGGEEDAGDCAFPGTFVALHIHAFPSHLADALRKQAFTLVFGLLSHEHRMSVLNMVLQKHPACAVPVKNKDELVFQVGCRRFTSNPLFSQHTNGNKFKMERFMPPGGAFCATTFAPITFTPAKVVVFRQTPTGRCQLVASGIVMDANPDRIVLKRAVLSGHPFKVNKRTAVVRYMFFNREDIEWFKPVELYTHSGRHGRVKQALGTHGLVKCIFDHPLSVQDSVLMNLFKRVFPKWKYNAQIAAAIDGGGGGRLADNADGLEEEEGGEFEQKNCCGKRVHFGGEKEEEDQDVMEE